MGRYKMAKIINIDDITKEEIASICDHTFLNRPETYSLPAKESEKASSVRMWREAFEGFLEDTVRMECAPYAICVRPENSRYTREYLDSADLADVKVASVVGFPDGCAYLTRFKKVETEIAIDHGAEEIDMVLDYELFKEGDIGYVSDDIVSVVETAHKKDVIVKLILETCELNLAHIAEACRLADSLEVDFVKTSTGFAEYGARAVDLRIMRNNFPRGVKISGGANPGNYRELLRASSQYDNQIELDPMKIRIGESSLLKKL